MALPPLPDVATTRVSRALAEARLDNPDFQPRPPFKEPTTIIIIDPNLALEPPERKHKHRAGRPVSPKADRQQVEPVGGLRRRNPAGGPILP
ncbi:MAG: hypothetical protein V3S43_06235 [Acidimicrobiia bacterium]